MPSVTIAGMAKRAIMKVESPSTTLFSVYKAFCEKANLNPEDFQLKDARGRILDLSLTWRLSGLANNTSLEIIPSSNKKVRFSAPATVVIDIDGTRLEDSFDTAKSLYEVLEHFQAKLGKQLTGHFYQEKGIFTSTTKYREPLIMYMNRQYKGTETLVKTTLQSIGINSKDKSLLKLMYETVSKSKDDVEKERKVIEERKKLDKEEEMVLTTPKNKDEKKVDFVEEISVRVTPIRKEEEIIEPKNESTIAPVAQEVVEAKIDTIKQEVKVSQPEMNGNEVESWLASIGMTKYFSNFVSQDVTTLEVVKELTLEELEQVLKITSFGDKKKIMLEIKNLSNVQPLKSQKQTPPIETKIVQKETKDVIDTLDIMDIENEVEKEPIEQYLLPLTDLVAQNVKLFKASQNSSFTKEEIDDEMFNVSIKDIAKFIKKTNVKEDEKMLMTQKMREIEDAKKKKIYTKVMIRVRIGEFMLQGTFKPSDKLEDVKKMICACITKPDLAFYIFQAPPVKKLEDLSKSLDWYKLTPASVVNVGTGSNGEKLEIKQEYVNLVQEFRQERLPTSEPVKKEEKKIEKVEKVVKTGEAPVDEEKKKQDQKLSKIAQFLK